MDECKPLPWSAAAAPARQSQNAGPPPSKGLHSFTFQLNLSAFYDIGGARRDCVARVKGVYVVFMACTVFLCVRHGSS